MDGRIVAAVLTLLLPAAGIGVTIYDFGSNPLSILGLLAVMVGGALYLLTYTDSF